VSFHFVVALAAVPKTSQRRIFDAVFPPALVQEIRELKRSGEAPADVVDRPYLFVDPCTFGGGQGFSMLFSRKKATDPLPSLTSRMTLCAKETQVMLFPEDWSGWACDHPQAPLMLFHACYSTPRAASIVPRAAFLARNQEVTCLPDARGAPLCSCDQEVTCLPDARGAPLCSCDQEVTCLPDAEEECLCDQGTEWARDLVAARDWVTYSLS